MWNSSTRSFCFLSLLLCFLLQGNMLHAANSTVKTVVYDSSKVELRSVPAEKQKALAGDSDYQYDRVAPPPSNWWGRFLRWLADLFKDTKGPGVSHFSLKIFNYLFMAAAIVAIIFVFLNNNARALFYRSSAPVAISIEELKEDIHQLDFDEMIAEALARKDFRKAVRLHFLKVLKQLSDKNLIAWQLDKTNIDYSMELSKSAYSSQFKEMAYLYEFVWYGDFQISETDYGNVVSTFKNFRIQ